MKNKLTETGMIISVLIFAIGLAWAGEGQIDIATLPYTINISGSYIITRDIALPTPDTNGITINTDNITLDLNGHALIGQGQLTSSTGSGIFVNGTHYNITIRNGTLRNWRENGVRASESRNCQIEALRCYSNGDNGILAGYNSRISKNTCQSNSTSGIYASTGNTVIENICSENAGDGIIASYGSIVSGNTCISNTGSGIYSQEGVTVSGNNCYSNTIAGIWVVSNSAVSGNTCTYNNGDGIQVSSNCRVTDNTSSNNGVGVTVGAGIHSVAQNNQIHNNTCVANDKGIDLDAANNIISGNVLRGNTSTAVEAAANNQLDILISELPYTILYSGMYRLTGALYLASTNTHGITIDADDVTLDLNGHVLNGPGKAAGSSGAGIYVNGFQYHIVIRNGNVRDWRGCGIDAHLAADGRFENLQCFNNGEDGLNVGAGNIVSGNNCLANANNGIYTGGSCRISGNNCHSNGVDGIYTANSRVIGNYCRSNTGDGIEVSGDCQVRDNECFENGSGVGDGAGIHVTYVGDNTIENNMVTDNDRGIDVDVAGNYIASNRASGNSTDYDIVGGNTQGAGDLANVSF